MADREKAKIALIRADSFTEYENKLWEKLRDFDVVGFGSRNKLYDTSKLGLNIKMLPSSKDNEIKNQFYKYFFGIYKKMNGLERELQDFDIAHTAEVFNYFTYQSVRAKKLNKRLKVVATVWENSFGRFEFNYWPGFKMPPKYWRSKLNEIIRTNVKGVDLFLPVSTYAAELLSDLGVEDRRVQVLTPGIIETEKQPLPDKMFEFQGKEYHVVVNRLVKEKGIYFVLYGWKMYLKKVSPENKRLLVIGKGKEKDNLVRLVQEFNLEKNVIFLDKLPNSLVKTIVMGAKVLMLGSIPNSSWQEQFGYVLAEAIAAGTPVISTDCGSIPEIVENAGLIIPPANPVALRDALLKFDDETTYQEMKKNCEVVKQKFSPDLFVDKINSIYKQLLAK